MSEIFKICDIADINAENIKKNDNYSEIKYLDTSNITRNKILDFQVFKSNYPSRAKRKVKEQSIIYSTVRPNQGHYGIFENRKDLNNIIVSSGFITIDRKSEKIDTKYLYYKLTSPGVTNYLQQIAENSVSAYPSIRPEILGNLQFRFPKLSAQKLIASILSNLDNKIELNDQINDNLPN